MPQTPHIERHFTASEMVRDIVIGMADGLTVPFALAAGSGDVAGLDHIWICQSPLYGRRTAAQRASDPRGRGIGGDCRLPHCPGYRMNFGK